MENSGMVLFLSAYLIVLSVWDFKEHKIPIGAVGIGMLGGIIFLLYKWSQGPMEWEWILIRALLGAIPGGIMISLSFVTNKIGLGDGMVLAVVGMFTGCGRCICLLGFSLLLMSLWCIVQLLRKKFTRNTEIPYLPFLTIVYLVGLTT